MRRGCLTILYDPNCTIKAKTALIGFGPANLGILLVAIKKGILEQLADGGLAIVEKTKLVGAGTLGTYETKAYSKGSVFIECLNDPALEPVFKDSPLRNSFEHLAKAANNPSLLIVAECIQQITESVISWIAKQYNVTILTEYSADSWKNQGCSHIFELARPKDRSKPIKNRKNLTLVCDVAFVNCGGQSNLNMRSERKVGEFTTTAHEFIKYPASKVEEAIKKRPSKKIAIFGTSHSAFCCVDKLLSVDCALEIYLFGRSKPKLFYNSEDEAYEASYNFDRYSDVCPITKRVNRFGGLRRDPRGIVRSLLKKPYVMVDNKVVRLNISTAPFVSAETERQFGLEIIAFGFVAAGPCNELHNNSVDGRLRNSNNQVVRGIYSIGLGSGLSKSPRIGGEPFFQKRIDGYWLYQNDLGERVLESYLADFALNKINP